MHIIFVHGWSVTHTNTYGDLPRWLERQSPRFNIQEIYLGKYITFVDTVTVDDIARAFQQALLDALGPKVEEGFACVTHSTGGPVVRQWMSLYYDGRLEECPLTHLIMLAPAHHGSALAQLGKGVMSRFKATLLDGVEPGVRVLDWLELGSDPSWILNERWLDYDCVRAGTYPFVLTGQRIDRKFYDHLNSYTDEAGSDGVVRAAAANLNYSLLRLHQDDQGGLGLTSRKRCPKTAFGVLPGRAHSGAEMGIIRSVTLRNASGHPTAQWVLRCLQVNSTEDYESVSRELDALTGATQKDERVEEVKRLFGTRKFHTSRYTMIIFRFMDDRGNSLTDYDLYITGGPRYSRDDLPPGFFVDRQRNKRNPGKLTYYLDYDVLRRGLSRKEMEGRIGFSVVARPELRPEALAYYRPLDFRSGESKVADILHPNETLMIEIQMRRFVDSRVFRIEPGLAPSPIEQRPLNRPVP